MTDDTERRLRESLRSANLPEAPEALRAAMHRVAASPEPSSSRRTWLRVMPAMAAVVVLAVVAGATTGGFGRFGTTASSAPSAVAANAATASGSPSQASSPDAPSPSAQANTGPRVYSTQEFAAAYGADHDALVGSTVLVSGTIGGTPGLTACGVDPPEEQTVCEGGSALAGTAIPISATRYTDSLMADSIVGPNPSGVLALRVLTRGVEFLGVMSSASGSDFEASVSDLHRVINVAAPLQSHVVTAWLGTSGPLPCPMADQKSTPPPDTPFNPCPWSWLAATASSNTPGADPDGAVRVQYSAFEAFAGAPTSSVEPQYGTYVVRLVLDTRTNGPAASRGWQVVGRLDDTISAPAPTPSPSISNAIEVFDAAGIEAALQADRASLVGKVVAVNGTISAGGAVPACLNVNGTAWDICGVSNLAGTSEHVSYDAVTDAVLRQTHALDQPLEGTLVVRVEANGLAFLGFLGADKHGASVNATVDGLRAPQTAGAVMTVRVVSGWLGADPGLLCAAPTRSPAPRITPFGDCERAWITSSAETPRAALMKKDGIDVQWPAYDQYAPNPVWSPNPQPRFGTYVVRLIQDTRDGTKGALGWQVIARLSP